MDAKNVFNGLKWASIELVFDALMKIGLKLVLAKLLLPEAFGLVGMCMVFIGVSQAISDLGFGVALIQKKEDSEAKKLFHTAFWTNLTMGVTMFLIVSFVVGPLVADFYGEPILRTLIPLLSINIIIAPLALISSIKLTRRLNFKFFAKVYNMGTFVSGFVAIIMAYYGFGVWSLVTQYMLAIVVPLPFLWRAAPYSPKFEWKKPQFKELFSFGIYSTGSSMMRAVMANSDYIVIGKLLGANLVGAYTLAFTLTDNMTNYLLRIINKVMYPVFSHHQNENQKLKTFFTTLLKINAVLVYPAMCVAFLFAEELILNIFGENWTDAIIPLKILAIAMIIGIFSNGFDTLLKAKGKPEIEFKIFAIVNFLVLLPCLAIFTYYFDLFGAVSAVLLGKIVIVSIALFYLNKEINLKLTDVIKSIKSPIFACLVGIGFYYLITEFF